MRLTVTIDDALEEIQVLHRDSCDQESVSTWWPTTLPYGVTTSQKGVIALFATEQAACHYRLMIVNQLLNDGWQLVD